MTSARLAAASVLALILFPAMTRAATVCERLTGAVDMAANGFDLAEGDPIASDSGRYWHSKIQFSDGDNCAIEAHKLLTCSWEPSTEADLKKMIDTVSGCFPAVHPETVKADDDDGPPGASFKFDQASIEIGLTADVLSVNIGPRAAPETPPPAAPAPSTPETAPQPAPAPTTPDAASQSPDTTPPPAAAPTTSDAAPPTSAEPTPPVTPDAGPTPAPPSTSAPATAAPTPQPESSPATPDSTPPPPPDATPPPAPDIGPTPTP